MLPARTRAGTRAVVAGGAAYLYGSLPLVYLLGRRRRVDLKRVGSGNVGATNLLAAAGFAGAALGWLFDASKGLLPIAVCRRLGYDERTARLAGVCGAAGQCWPLFLGLNGGRGISAFVGAAYMMDRRAWGGALLPMIAGSLWHVAGRPAHRSDDTADTDGGSRHGGRGKAVPLGCFVSALAFPALCAAFDLDAPKRRKAPTTPAPALLALVILLRRLTAPLPDDATHGPAVQPRALLYRLLYDRNTSR
ncbi:MAG TPA: glycerol-3-phosphate acyltransferase [Ktedonobacterales bacterium]|nr:glycerol-3-phosphate acyltransferase [Ktedonobacterales bacterium]